MTASSRERMAGVAERGAWFAFVVLVVVSPMRARLTIDARRTATVYGDYTDFLLFVSDVALLATVALWFVSLVGRRRAVWFGPRFVRWPVAAILIVMGVGVPFAVDVPLAAYTSVRFLVLAALAVYVVNEVGRLSRLVAPLAVMVVVQAVIGIGQVVGQRSVGVGWLGEHVLAPSLGVSVVTANDGVRTLRAYGLTDHPNILGGVLAMALLLLAGVIITQGDRVNHADRSTWWLTVVFALGGAALLVTFSRGAWLGLLAGLLVAAGMLMLMRDRVALRRLGSLCVAGLMVAAPFALPFRHVMSVRASASRRSATEVRSVSERVALSDATTRIVSDHPLVGVGIASLPLAMRAAQPSFAYPYQPAAVVLLDVTAELGVLGGAAYLVVVTAPWVALLRRRTRWTGELAAASAALVALTVVGLFDYYPWTYSAGRIWTWLVLSLWLMVYRNATSRSADAV